MTRPASFDAAVAAYVPGLYRLAIRIKPPGVESDDLVNDTVEAALRRWHSYRPGGKIYTWLAFMMRHVKARYARPGAVETVPDFAPDDAPEHPSVGAPQEHALDIKRALERATPRGRALLAMAAQEFTFDEMGAAIGVSKQRASQLLQAERERLASLAAQADTRRDVAYGRV